MVYSNNEHFFLLENYFAKLFRFRTTNIIILGDLNASPPYVSSMDWASNRLKTNSKYHWLIQGKGYQIAELTYHFDIK
jgi:hypothetical protein